MDLMRATLHIEKGLSKLAIGHGDKILFVGVNTSSIAKAF